MAGANTYAFGECTYGVALELDWVRGGWGNATDWCGRAARDGFQLTLVPTAGSVVTYAAGDGYSIFGHVAEVKDVYASGAFLVREMNYVAWDQWDSRVSSQDDVECFILPPGVGPGQGPGPGGRGGPGDIPPGANNVIGNWWYFGQAVDVYWPTLNAYLENDPAAFATIG